MIELRGAGKVYRVSREVSVTAVRHASLIVQCGEFIVITGRSGSGKTTLLNLVGGMTKPTAGQVLLDGIDLWQSTDRQRSLWRNQKIGFVFQSPSLLPSLTALENIALPAAFGPAQAKRGVYRRATELLETIGLADKLAAYPRQLSAGQQQRLVIARSLINRPELLLADEPTSDLDERTEQEIMALLHRVHAAGGITILMVTHTTQLVKYGTRSFEMANGAISKSGIPPSPSSSLTEQT